MPGKQIPVELSQTCLESREDAALIPDPNGTNPDISSPMNLGSI